MLLNLKLRDFDLKMLNLDILIEIGFCFDVRFLLDLIFLFLFDLLYVGGIFLFIIEMILVLSF